MVTLRDVAREAGVSLPTVSHVLNCRDTRYSPATCVRVRETARRMGYHRNEVARAMVRGRTGIIGVLGFVSSKIYGGEQLANLAGTLKQAGWRMHLALRDAGDIQAEEDYINDLVSQQVEGLMISADPLRSPAHYHALRRASDIPIVLMGSPYERPEVWIDSPSAMRAATQHLLDLGHRRIVYAVGEDISRKYPLHRVSGFLRAMQDAGAPLQQDWLPGEICDFREHVQAFTRKVLRATPRPTALMYTNDEMALVGLHTILSMGLRVPRDVSIMGFDDLPLSQLTWPELTTVRQPFPEMHRLTLQFLLDRIEKGKRARTASRILKAELIVRQSTGPAPGERK
ncbi:MAG: LacI family DNA-binding transcriptional regulator [Kiritimatiellae bacterium]|nr:LacI family DNA-binding transcriptional regulator [Kiritimatiellia bacterium]